MSEETEADKNARKMPRGVHDGIIKVSGKDYLPVPYRLVWMRDEKPLWGISTEIIEVAGYTLVRATVTDETGRTISTAHKAVTGGGKFPPIEKAETGAMGRALGAAGFGTQFGELDDEEPGVMGGIADSPVSRTRNNGNVQTQYPATIQNQHGAHEPVNTQTGEIHEDVASRPPISEIQKARSDFRQACAAIYPAMAHPMEAPVKVLGKMVACINQDGSDLDLIMKYVPSWVYATQVLTDFRKRYPTATPARIMEAMKGAYRTDKRMTEWTDTMWNDLVLFEEKVEA